MKDHSIEGKNLIGDRLRMLRRSRRITQTAVAAQMQLLGLPITSAGICRIESGCRPVSDKELRALSRLFRVSYAYLIDGEEEDSVHRDREEG